MKNNRTAPSVDAGWQLIAHHGLRYFQWRARGVRLLYSIRGSEHLFIQEFQPLFVRQVHSDVIVNVDDQTTKNGDGLISYKKECAIGVKVADCLPVYMFNETAACIIHCGWRGIVKGIARKAATLMGDYQYVLGASIGPCCYDVKDDVTALFMHSYEDAVVIRNGRTYIDLKKAVIHDLGDEHMIGSLEYCTQCQSRYFYSHRRGDNKKRNYAMLMREEEHNEDGLS